MLTLDDIPRFVPSEKMFDLVVTSVLDTTLFYGQYADVDIINAIGKMSVKIENLLKDASPPKEFRPQKGTVCAGLHAEYGEWYRVLVSDTKVSSATVLLLDHGEKTEIAFKDLRPLLPEMCDFPIQGIACSLNNHSKLDQSALEKLTTEISFQKITVQKLSEHDGVILVQASKDGVDIMEKLVGPSEIPKVQGPETTPSKRMMYSDLPSLDPLSVKEFEVLVLSVNDFDEIGVWLGNTKELRARVFKTTVNLSERLRLCEKIYSPIVGELCGAYNEEDEEWYRVHILEVNKSECRVQLIDYGNIRKMNVKHLCPLADEIFCTPADATFLGIDNTEIEKNPANLTILKEKIEMKIVVCDVIGYTNNKYQVSMITGLGGEDILSIIVKEKEEEEKVLQFKKYIISDIPKFKSEKSTFDIVVTSVQSPRLFHGQLADSESIKAVNKLSTDIEKMIIDSDIHPVEPKVDEVYVGFHEQYGAWYRICIMELHKSDASVLLLDYGEKASIPFRHLCHLPDELSSLAVQSIPCCCHEQIELDSSITAAFQKEVLLQKVTIEKKSELNGVFQVIVKKGGDDLMQKISRINSPSPQNFTQIPPETAIACTPLSSLATEPAAESEEQTSQIDEFTKLPLMKVPTECDVMVTHIDSLSLFYGQVYEEEIAKKDYDMTVQINSHCNDSSGTHTPSVGEICCGLFDTNWYRVFVSQVGTTTASVYFIDFGNSVDLTFDCLRKCPKEFLQIPSLAVAFKLQDDHLYSNSKANIDLFRQKLQNEFVKVRVVSRVGKVISVNVIYEGDNITKCLGKDNTQENQSKPSDSLVNKELRHLSGKAPCPEVTDNCPQVSESTIAKDCVETSIKVADLDTKVPEGNIESAIKIVDIATIKPVEELIATTQPVEELLATTQPVEELQKKILELPKDELEAPHEIDESDNSEISSSLTNGVGDSRTSLNETELETGASGTLSISSIPKSVHPLEPVSMRMDLAVLPAKASCLTITHVVSPHLVYGVSSDEIMIEKRAKLEKDMLEFYENSTENLGELKLKAGTLCACKGDEGKWHRAILTDVQEASCSVFLFDLGTTLLNIQHSQAKPLQKEFRSLPAQVIPVKLMTVRPLKDMNGTWSHDAIEYFRGIVDGRTLSILPKYREGVLTHVKMKVMPDKELVEKLFESGGYAEVFQPVIPTVKKYEDYQNQNDGERKGVPFEDVTQVIDIEKVSGTFQGVVTCVVSPRLFYCRLQDPVKRKHVENMGFGMNLLFGSGPQNTVPLKKGDLVAAVFKEKEWYRGYIIGTYPTTGKWIVWLLDFGIRGFFSPDCLWPLPENMKDFPAQALTLQLHETVPIDKNKYSQECIKFFKSLTMNESQEKVMKIEVRKMHGLIHRVVIYDPETGMNLSQALVKCGYATYHVPKYASFSDKSPQVELSEKAPRFSKPKDNSPFVGNKRPNLMDVNPYGNEQNGTYREAYQFNQQINGGTSRHMNGYDHHQNHRKDKENEFRGKNEMGYNERRRDQVESSDYNGYNMHDYPPTRCDKCVSCDQHVPNRYYQPGNYKQQHHGDRRINERQGQREFPYPGEGGRRMDERHHPREFPSDGDRKMSEEQRKMSEKQREQQREFLGDFTPKKTSNKEQHSPHHPNQIPRHPHQVPRSPNQFPHHPNHRYENHYQGDYYHDHHQDNFYEQYEQQPYSDNPGYRSSRFPPGYHREVPKEFAPDRSFQRNGSEEHYGGGYAGGYGESTQASYWQSSKKPSYSPSNMDHSRDVDHMRGRGRGRGRQSYGRGAATK